MLGWLAPVTRHESSHSALGMLPFPRLWPPHQLSLPLPDARPTSALPSAVTSPEGTFPSEPALPKGAESSRS